MIRLSMLHFPVRVGRRLLTTVSGAGLIPVVDPGNMEDSAVSILLIPEDYPASFRGLKEGTVLYAHPDDYKSDVEPIKPYVFLYKAGARQQLFLRASTKVDDKKYTTATYMFDTGCSVPLQISENLNNKIRGRILKSDSADYIKSTMANRENNLTVHYDLPKVHKPANIAGLPLFFLLNVTFKHESVGRLENDEEGVSRDACTIDPTFKFF